MINSLCLNTGCLNEDTLKIGIIIRRTKYDNNYDNNNTNLMNSGGKRRNRKGGKRRNRKGGKRRNRKGGKRQNRKGGKRRNKKGSKRRNRKGGKRRNKKGSKRRNKKGNRKGRKGRSSSSGRSCPASHPYVYYNGHYCCKTNREKHYKPQGSKCDGSVISRSSLCCAGNQFTKCPKGVCGNYRRASKKRNKKGGKRRNKKGNKRRNRKHNKRGNKKRNKKGNRKRNRKHNKRGSKKSSSGRSCPASHPYVYYNGHYCCKTNREKHYKPQGSKCDGSVISRSSLCCAGNQFTKCPKGVCGNYRRASKKRNKKGGKRRNKKGNKRRNRKHNKRGNKKRNKKGNRKHNKRGSRKSSSGRSCPASHPYVYYNGHYCCKTNREKHYKPQGSKCDGSVISRSSLCCAGNQFTKCPKGVCGNYRRASKKRNKKGGKRRNKKGNKRRNRKHNKRGNKKRNKKGNRKRNRKHNKRGSRKSSSGRSCPASHPYVYYNGHYCCKTNREKHYKPQGSKCDGSVISRSSLCCAGNQFTKCPKGVCGNYRRASKKRNKKGGKRRNKKGNKRRNRKHNKRGNKKRNKKGNRKRNRKHNKRGSRKSSSGRSCPASHPYVYYNGHYCCKTNREKHYKPQGSKCDGSVISRSSLCCAGNQFTKCPKGVCGNYRRASKKRNKKGGKRRNKKGNKRRNRKHNKRGNKKRNKKGNRKRNRKHNKRGSKKSSSGRSCPASHPYVYYNGHYCCKTNREKHYKPQGSKCDGSVISRSSLCCAGNQFTKCPKGVCGNYRRASKKRNKKGGKRRNKKGNKRRNRKHNKRGNKKRNKKGNRKRNRKHNKRGSKKSSSGRSCPASHPYVYYNGHYCCKTNREKHYKPQGSKCDGSVISRSSLCCAGNQFTKCPKGVCGNYRRASKKRNKKGGKRRNKKGNKRRNRKHNKRGNKKRNKKGNRKRNRKHNKRGSKKSSSGRSCPASHPYVYYNGHYCCKTNREKHYKPQGSKCDGSVISRSSLCCAGNQFTKCPKGVCGNYRRASKKRNKKGGKRRNKKGNKRRNRKHNKRGNKKRNKKGNRKRNRKHNKRGSKKSSSGRSCPASHPYVYYNGHYCCKTNREKHYKPQGSKCDGSVISRSSLCCAGNQFTKCPKGVCGNYRRASKKRNKKGGKRRNKKGNKRRNRKHNKRGNKKRNKKGNRKRNRKHNKRGSRKSSSGRSCPASHPYVYYNGHYCCKTNREKHYKPQGSKCDGSVISRSSLCCAGNQFTKCPKGVCGNYRRASKKRNKKGGKRRNKKGNKRRNRKHNKRGNKKRNKKGNRKRNRKHNKRGSKKSSSGRSCPASHPYVYYNGHYCCKTNREKHYKPQGSKCDGSVISRSSLCCAGNQFTKCPKGVCGNYRRASKKRNKKGGKRRNKKGNKRRNRKHNKRGNKKRNKKGNRKRNRKHNKRGSKKSSSGRSCPASHPYVYYNGHYCCKTNREKHYKPQGSKCDGSVISRSSLCCAGNQFTKCPKGVCGNYRRASKKRNKKGGKRRNKKGNKRRNRKHNKRGNKKRNKKGNRKRNRKHNKRGSKKSSSGRSCPASHPYVYYNGHYCCKTNREKHYKPQGSKCDGSVISRSSLCCAGNQFTKCPKGVCGNYRRASKKRNKKGGKRRNKKGNKRRNRKHNKRGNKKRNKKGNRKRNRKHNKRGSKKSSSGRSCPASHPYVYYNGHYCCKTNREKHYKPQGSKCDGSVISRSSLCCAGNQFTKCPKGVCGNYRRASKKRNKKGGKRRNKKGNKRRNRKHNKRGNKKRNKKGNRKRNRKHNKRGSKKSSSGRSCPASHPYVYYNGHYCCRTNREKHYKPQGSKCDGSVISRSSLCCAGNQFTKCPKGVCGNYRRASKKRNKKGGKRRNKKGNKRRNRKHNKRGNKKRNKKGNRKRNRKHNKRGSKKSSSGRSCPASHPYVYYNGHYCCKTNREKHYKPQGSKCDGSVISRSSLCCAGNQFTKCPKGVCGNYRRASKKRNKKGGKRRNKKGNKRRNRKHNKRGNKKRNKKGNRKRNRKHNKRGSKKSSSHRSCPASHPYVYYNGHYCCKTNREKHYKPQGSKCDGSVISRSSLCCAGNQFTKCPKGVCGNYRRASKKRNKKGGKRRNKKGNKRRNRKHNKRGNKKRNKKGNRKRNRKHNKKGNKRGTKKGI